MVRILGTTISLKERLAQSEREVYKKCIGVFWKRCYFIKKYEIWIGIAVPRNGETKATL
jgi:hypothetical protein